MKHKRLATLALATALTATIFTPAFAGSAASAASPDTAAVGGAVQDQQIIDRARTIGTVQAVGEDYVLVKNDQMEIRFNINEKTWLVDGQQGIPTTLQELNGQEVVVSHSPAMTKSLPPQSYAYAIITKSDVLPNYAVIEEVAHSNGSGAVRLTTDNGGMWVTVQESADIKPLRTKEIVTLRDLQPGAQVILYYDMVALSYPGQAMTDRVVLLQSAAEQAEPAEATPTMVSLRDAAGQLGLATEWNQQGQTVLLRKGAFTATVVIGSHDYSINKSRVQLEQPAELREGRTYVPQEFVNLLKEQTAVTPLQP